MKIGIFGTGALGGFYGGVLVKGGVDVVFIARGKILKAIKKRGLTIKSFKHGQFTVNVKARENPEEAGKADVVLLCVKSYDTERVAPLLLPMLKEDSVVISVQNGIENEEILSKVVGKDRVFGATAFIGTYVESPGIVVHQAAGLLEIGELSGKVTERVERIVNFLKSNGIEARVSKDINYALWKKLLWNVSFNPYSVMTRATVSQMLKVSETKEVLRNLMEEATLVAKAYGIELKTKTIDDYLNPSEDLMDYKTSMLVDFERGKTLEIEGITGALIRKARNKGIDIPYNKCVYATVKLLEKYRT
ncbi:MAG: 2-dehydropantoate 2-reductase [Syntrophobacter sp. DG_60]|nr:MAG: 2-dehydropantoate 2-reductase [Syntrophobacter sp. DG_60]